MRKLFRFKYEPCNGTCYAWCDHLPNELMKMDEEQRHLTIRTMVAAHDRLCDNPDYSFGVDLDHNTGIFVAHFRTPTNTEIFANISFADVVKEVTDQVMSTEIPTISGACTYGDNGAENLGAEILKACLDLDYRQAHHDNCPCLKVA